MCGFNLENKDPAAQYLKYELLVYLDSHNYVSAPEWNPNDLRIRQKKNHDFNFKIVKTDEGGRPVYNWIGDFVNIYGSTYFYKDRKSDMFSFCLL